MLTIVDYLFIACLIIIWTILFYHALLAYCGYRFSLQAEIEKSQIKHDYTQDLPTVSILIPAHNEELVIEETLKAMANLEYPEDKLEILCLNDNSTDETYEVATNTVKKLNKKNIKVINVPPERGKRGKSAVLNYGITIAKGEVIAVYDADNTPEKMALFYLAKNLVNEKKNNIGAVIGKFRTRNKDKNILTKFINLETIFFQWTTQAGRWFLYKLCTIPGTNFVIWRKLIDELNGWDEKALTEDTELSIRIYQKGYKIKMAPYATTWEEEPDRLKVWFKQRTRWAMGNIYVLKKYFFPLLFSFRFDLLIDFLYLIMIYFLFFTSVVTSLIIMILGIIGITSINLEGPFNILWIMSIILFVLELGITLTAEPGEDKGKNLLYGFLMYFTYTQLWLFVIINAIIKTIINTIRGSTTFWHKTERAR